MRALSETDLRVTQPLYTLSETARLLELPRSTMHAWAFPIDGPPLITIVRKAGYGATVPFIGFAEAFVISMARRAGVPRRRIRPNVEAVQTRAGGVPHALAHRLVFTDGAEILLAHAGEDDLSVPRTWQQQMRLTVENQLRLISFAGDGYAERIRLPKYEVAEVTVDPKVASGRPLIESGGARVEDVISRYRAGDSIESIASDFEVRIEEVRELIGYA